MDAPATATAAITKLSHNAQNPPQARQSRRWQTQQDKREHPEQTKTRQLEKEKQRAAAYQDPGILFCIDGIDGAAGTCSNMCQHGVMFTSNLQWTPRTHEPQSSHGAACTHSILQNLSTAPFSAKRYPRTLVEKPKEFLILPKHNGKPIPRTALHGQQQHSKSICASSRNSGQIPSVEQGHRSSEPMQRSIPMMNTRTAGTDRTTRFSCRNNSTSASVMPKSHGKSVEFLCLAMHLHITCASDQRQSRSKGLRKYRIACWHAPN